MLEMGSGASFGVARHMAKKQAMSTRKVKQRGVGMEELADNVNGSGGVGLRIGLRSRKAETRFAQQSTLDWKVAGSKYRTRRKNHEEKKYEN